MTTANQKSLNDLNFKILIFMPLLITAIDIIVSVFIIKNNIEIEAPESIIMLIRIILYVIIFKRDLSLLKEKIAFVPPWGWFFIMPVYIFLRQKRNNLSLGYFGLYIINIIIGLFISGIAIQLLRTI
ncbi:hypothetical protein [Acinetobacter baumannii]|uniref:hypothetical protein n=1 Tax=Acinetobacter baumannii TaxID=470 RepID=UPI003891E659